MSEPETPDASDFRFTGSIVTYVVPSAGVYQIVTSGAEGGTGEGNTYGLNPVSGGLGGQVTGNFTLAQGETLEIAVAGQGNNPSNFGGSYHVGAGGGGGGSYVVLLGDGGNTVLEAAGGGGGGGFALGSFDAVGGASGLQDSGAGDGGTADRDAGGGTGVFSDGATAVTLSSDDVPGVGGSDFVEGLAGGSPGYTMNTQLLSGGGGGFGGGGGGASGAGSGGGGGGYSGGGAGEGGSSYIAPQAMDVASAPGVQLGDGEVTIDLEPIVQLECFAQGTRIATAAGANSVEALRPGNLVLSVRRNVPVCIRRVCRRHVDCARHPDPAKILPVRIRANAFGLGLPARDLWLSPGHAVFAEGVLIPVRTLVNGFSIAQQKVSYVTYWHVEVDQHDILLAEGLPVESYLDTSQQAASICCSLSSAKLPADFACRIWEAEGCAPLRVTGPEVDAVQALIMRQAKASPARRAFIGDRQH